MASTVRVDLDGNPIKAMTICMVGAGGFIWSHMCEKLMAETPHKVLAVDVYNDKIKHLLEPSSLPWADRIHFHRINIKNDSRLEGLIKMADLTINLAAICTPADYNTRPLDTIYSNFIDALPVVKYCSETTSVLFTSLLVKSMGKQLVAFFLKITLCGRILLILFLKKMIPPAFLALLRSRGGPMLVQSN
ncbi:UDP-D-apiose/UDP-D-xylose synthase [Actinidia chinensis var. chinensis]|uniref:UDP-D-apiose/UDP-D-xylose synthase n=1 Tax=Actinidia chinensis var. chinensis TaxID=1590841 RepID=A0A2R6QT75_ACTCC|nr:UDP-D-apiose/UDP-D-xylose synthase [Actinidia chinensis var. chinensis]